MPAPLVLPLRAGRINHPFWSILPPVGLTVLFGIPVYWLFLMLAFYENTTPIWPELLVFTACVVLCATLAGLSVLFSAAWEPEAMVVQLMAFGVLGSLAFNAAVVGVGTIVSAFNADSGSVTASLNTPVDVLVAAAYLGAAAVLALLANGVRGVRAAG